MELFETKKKGTATRNEGDTFWRRGATYSQCGNMKNLLSPFFRQIHSLVTSLEKHYFHEIFVKKV